MISPVSNGTTAWQNNSRASGTQSGEFNQILATQNNAASASRTVTTPVSGSLLGRVDFMATTYGDAWDPATKKVDFQRFLANTARRTEAFADKLNERLRNAGIDTSKPIQLMATGDGGVKVDGDHPDKDAIEKMFADDLDLADEYRRVAGANEWAAAAQIAGSYTQAYGACTNNAERDAVWSRFYGYQKELEKEGAKMTLSNGGLTSGAMAALTRINQTAGLGLSLPLA